MDVVTGVDGHFGSTVAEIVLAKVPASQLIFTSWDVSRIVHWAERGVQVRQADFDDLAQTTEAFRGGDRLLLGHPGHVTGPELFTSRQICGLVAEVSGAQIEYVEMTDEVMYGMWDAMGVPRESTGNFSASPAPWCSDDMVSFGRAIREGMMAVRTDVVAQLTGRAPKTMRQLMETAEPAWPAPVTAA